MCQTVEGSRQRSEFVVMDGTPIRGCEEQVHQVLFRKHYATMASALLYFMEHHLRGREIVSFSVDPMTCHYPSRFDDDPEYHTLVILTRVRPFKHNSDM